MPVHQKINAQLLSRAHELHSGDEFRPVSIRLLDSTGRIEMRLFHNKLIMDQWLSTHEATTFEILGVT